MKAVVEHVAATSVGSRGRVVQVRFVSWEDFWPKDVGKTVWLWDEQPPKPLALKPVARMNFGELQAELGTMTDGERRSFLKANWSVKLASDNPAHLREVVLELRRIRGS